MALGRSIPHPCSPECGSRYFSSLVKAVLVGHWFLVNIRNLILIKANKYVQPPRLPACISPLTFPLLRDPDKALKPLYPKPGENS